MTSLWLANSNRNPAGTTRLDDVPPSADAIVVGAGITGLVTALLLARAGKEVLVLEARSVGACTTGNTTGKLSLLQATNLSKILSKHGRHTARDYVDGNREGMEWILRHCANHDVAVQREDVYTYAQSADGLSETRAELSACKETGLTATWEHEAEVPFSFRGGVRLANQAQLDPVELLDSLATEFVGHGGRLVEHARVRRVSARGSRVRVSVDDGTRPSHDIHTDTVVLATGTPILDRGGFFARVKPQRSYCMSFTVPGAVTRPMLISADAPTRSVRYAPSSDGDVLIVGGAGHPVGRAENPAAALAELKAWTEQYYPGAVQTHFWSAQDYSPIHQLPYAGPILPGVHNLYVATGFNKWGMTNGPAAALALSSRILGGKMTWAHAFATWSHHELSGLTTALQSNFEVALNLGTGWARPLARWASRSPDADGVGVVSGPPWHLEARCRVDGVDASVSPVCPHLGGIVRWNNADLAWECPLHGSRFAPDGTLLEGPATANLTPSA